MAEFLEIYICIIICFKTVECCDCEKKNTTKDPIVKDSQIVIDNHQTVDDNEDDSGWMNDLSNKFEIHPTDQRATTEKNEIVGLIEESEETTEYSFESTTVDTDEETQRNECLFFKEGPNSNFEKMVDDVWKITFYKASVELYCIKIYIKKTSFENRSMYSEMYGDFNGTVEWINCQFEVRSTARRSSTSFQRHFLQGTEEDKGVFKNVIIVREENDDTFSLLEQGSNQWLVIKNLLLMRDCDNGEVFVFSKFPLEPSMRDIKNALALFGEDYTNGTMACETIKHPKHRTLS